MPLVRFHFRAWVCRANMPSSKHGYLIRPLRGHLPLKGKVAGHKARRMRREPKGLPYENNETISCCAVVL